MSWCARLPEATLHGLTAMKDLNKLNLSRCKLIGDEGVSVICILENLQILSLDACVKITDAGLKVRLIKHYVTAKKGFWTPIATA